MVALDEIKPGDIFMLSNKGLAIVISKNCTVSSHYSYIKYFFNGKVNIIVSDNAHIYGFYHL